MQSCDSLRDSPEMYCKISVLQTYVEAQHCVEELESGSLIKI